MTRGRPRKYGGSARTRHQIAQRVYRQKQETENPPPERLLYHGDPREFEQVVFDQLSGLGFDRETASRRARAVAERVRVSNELRRIEGRL